MIVDCHVHISACTAAHGRMSSRLLNSIPFRFMRWRFGLKGADERTECALEQKLARTIDETPEIDAAVVLAFDAVHRDDGSIDDANTHLYVKNDYVIDLSRKHSAMLFGASVHPYRRDAVAEIERCASAGAVLMKWLPVTQGMNPADPRCIPFYEALAHHGIPLLCHTGGEKSLPQMDMKLADPMLLVPALERGVTVIAAHCGTRSWPGEPDYLGEFLDLVRRYENCYGDTAALNLPMRSHAYPAILNDPDARGKMIHGSDWPILPLPPISQLGTPASLELLLEPNWLRRDVLIKRRLGFDDAYWHRAATILRMPEKMNLRTHADQRE